MEPGSPERRSAAAEEQPRGACRCGGRAVAAICLVIALGGLGLRYGLRPAAPKPPVVALEGLDVAISNQVYTTSAEVQKSPRSGSNWGKLGMVLMNYEFRPEARFALSNAQHFSRADARWPYFLALLLMVDDAEAAMAHLRVAVGLAGGTTDIPTLRLAQALSDRGKCDEARVIYQRLLDAAADHPICLLGLGKCALASGRLEESRAILERCAENPYSRRQAQLLLATLRQRLGKPAEAEAISMKASGLPYDRLWPDPLAAEALRLKTGCRAWLEAADLLMKQGRHDQAIPLVERTLKDYPETADGWLLMGRIRMDLKDFSAAEQALIENIRLDPNSLEGRVQLGVSQLMQGRPAGAAESFRRAIEINPDLGEGFFNLGLALAGQNKIDEALSALREAVRLKPDLAEGYLAIANLLQQQGHLAEARTQAEHALKIRPGDVRVTKFLEHLK